MDRDALALLAFVALIAIAVYAASRGLRLKHQREIIARLEDLRQRQKEMADRIGRPVQPATAAMELESLPRDEADRR